MAQPAAPDAGHHLLRFPLPGGVEAVRLPSAMADEVLDEALRSDSPWLLLDATGAEDSAETVAPQVVRALGRSSRAAARTCLVCRRRVPAVAVEVATFATVEDACLARVFEAAGFGAGWEPAPLVVPGSRRLVALS